MSKAEVNISDISPAQIGELLLLDYGLTVAFASPSPNASGAQDGMRVGTGWIGAEGMDRPECPTADGDAPLDVGWDVTHSSAAERQRIVCGQIRCSCRREPSLRKGM